MRSRLQSETLGDGSTVACPRYPGKLADGVARAPIVCMFGRARIFFRTFARFRHDCMCNAYRPALSPMTDPDTIRGPVPRPLLRDEIRERGGNGARDATHGTEAAVLTSASRAPQPMLLI